jgi:phenylpropionate dioxygenase-like ring-hydroxylating dioxygenase large terminal subunit
MEAVMNSSHVFLYSHIHYVHSDSFGNQDKPEIKDMKVTTDPFSVTATFSMHNKPASALWAWTQVPVVHVTATAYLPSSSVISFTLANNLSFSTVVNVTPIDANKTVNRFALVRKLGDENGGLMEREMSRLFNADAWDVFARRAMLEILGQDKGIVEKLRPELLAHEFNVEADRPQLAFRKLRQQWVDLGYGRDPDYGAMAEGHGLSFRPDF